MSVPAADGTQEFRRNAARLLGAFLGVATGISSLFFYSQGLFLKPLAEAFHWSRGEASLGPLVGTLAAAIASGPTGRLMDRIGAPTSAIAGMALLGCGFVVLGLGTSSLATFLAITAVMSLLTVGSSPLAYSRLLIEGFDRHRGLALGLALTGTGAGAFLLPVFLGPIIATSGWRVGYFALAGIVGVAIIPVALLLRGRHVQPTARAPLPPLSTVIRDPAFGMMGLLFMLAATGALGTVVHFPAMLSDAGLPPARIGLLAGSIGIAVIAGRAASGLLLDRVPARLVTASFFALSALGLLMLSFGGMSYALPGALALGLSVGAEVDLIAYLVSRSFARNVYGTAYGGIYGMFLVGGALGPAAMGIIFDRTGDYRASLCFAAVCLGLAALLALRLKPRATRHSDRLPG